MPNNATKIELEHAIGVDTSDLAAKKDFIALKADVDKVDINELVKVPTSLNDLKAKIVDLDVGMLKTVPLDLKKFSDVVRKEVVEKTVYNTLNNKVNDLENKFSDISILDRDCRVWIHSEMCT